MYIKPTEDALRADLLNRLARPQGTRRDHTSVNSNASPIRKEQPCGQKYTSEVVVETGYRKEEDVVKGTPEANRQSRHLRLWLLTSMCHVVSL